MSARSLSSDGPHGHRAIAHSIRQVVEETLWPTRCAVCDRPGDLLCEDCRRALRFVDALRACPLCGAPHGAVQCTECNPVMLAGSHRDVFPFDAMASAVTLDDGARRLVLAYKDGGEHRLAPLIGELMAPYVPPHWLRERPTVTFIPSTRTARLRRGFDHGELTSRTVAASLGLPHASLFAMPHSTDQRKLSRHDRAANMGAALSLGIAGPLPSACLVVDDVCTTGATLYGAADALAQAGVTRRYALTFARA